jgi:hypothetical protein
LIKDVVIGLSTVVSQSNEIYLDIIEPTTTDQSLLEFRLLHGEIALPYKGFPRDVLAVQLPFSNVNRDHPLVKEAIGAKYLKELSDLDLFAQWAVGDLGNISDLVSFLKMLPTDGKGYFMRLLGHQYSKVDWSRFKRELSPPYKLWSKDSGLIEITEDDFKNWASAKTRLKTSDLHEN